MTFLLKVCIIILLFYHSLQEKFQNPIELEIDKKFQVDDKYLELLGLATSTSNQKELLLHPDQASYGINKNQTFPFVIVSAVSLKFYVVYITFLISYSY